MKLGILTAIVLTSVSLTQAQLSLLPGDANIAPAAGDQAAPDVRLMPGDWVRGQRMSVEGVFGPVVTAARTLNCPDDGLFCNGTEFCDPATGCGSSGDPCASDENCDEDTDLCVPCAPKNRPCATNAECCSGTCRSNGRCNWKGTRRGRRCDRDEQVSVGNVEVRDYASSRVPAS